MCNSEERERDENLSESEAGSEGSEVREGTVIGGALRLLSPRRSNGAPVRVLLGFPIPNRSERERERERLCGEKEGENRRE